MAIPDDEFETMIARARRFRQRVEELGSVSGPVIEQHVRDRLSGRDRRTILPPAQRELADEILAVLENQRLAMHQAQHLEREFFGG